jgi:hypothetical protein
MTRISAVREIAVFLAGWDHDPRELGDIPEAADYVRRWARFAGITLQSTTALVSAGKTQPDTLGLLAACGVFRRRYPTRRNRSTLAFTRTIRESTSHSVCVSVIDREPGFISSDQQPVRPGVRAFLGKLSEYHVPLRGHAGTVGKGPKGNEARVGVGGGRSRCRCRASFSMTFVILLTALGVVEQRAE